MARSLNSQDGLTLVETIAAIAVVLILVTATASSIFNSQFLSSYSKHRIQAAYAAAQIMEQERRLAFSNIISVASAPVTLDTNGTYNTTADDFNGTVIITVTTVNTYIKKVQVQISWPERLLNKPITANETYATNIANEPLLN